MSIEIGDYREINKGALLGCFSFTISPGGYVLFECKLFEKDGKRWITYPQKEVVKEGEKTRYFPLFKVLNKDSDEKLQADLIEALKPFIGDNSVQKNPREKNPIPSDAPSIWG